MDSLLVWRRSCNAPGSVAYHARFPPTFTLRHQAASKRFFRAEGGGLDADKIRGELQRNVEGTDVPLAVVDVLVGQLPVL